MTAEQRPDHRELFKDLAARMYAAGVPVAALIRAAEADQARGDDGAFLELEPDEYGPGATIAVRHDTVDVKVGGEDFVLDLDEVKQKYTAESQDRPPADPQA